MKMSKEVKNVSKALAAIILLILGIAFSAYVIAEPKAFVFQDGEGTFPDSLIVTVDGQPGGHQEEGPPYAYDFDRDGNVDLKDLAVVQGCLGDPSPCSNNLAVICDTNWDLKVDQEDLDEVQACIDGTGPCPKAITISGKVTLADGTPVPGVQILMHTTPGTSKRERGWVP